MINRREVMASGIALTLLTRASAATIPAAAPAANRAGRAEPFVFVADERAAEARAAARAAVSLGAVARPLATDITPVYEWLDLSLRAAPVPVAGLATPRALFAIERLAWDRGLRTVYRGVHRRVRGQTPTHELSGSPAIVERVRHLEARDWAGLGHALAAAAPEPAAVRHVVTSQRLPRSGDDVLVSWLLVPRAALRPGSQPETNRS